MIDIDEVCRLCANRNTKLVSIYSKEGITTELERKINSYLPIKVSAHDDLPVHCCCGCTSTILAWHELFVGCMEADRRLRSHEAISKECHSPGGSIGVSHVDCGESDSEGDKLSEIVHSHQHENYDVSLENTTNNDEKIEHVLENVEKETESYTCQESAVIFPTAKQPVNHSKTHKTISSPKSYNCKTIFPTEKESVNHPKICKTSRRTRGIRSTKLNRITTDIGNCSTTKEGDSENFTVSTPDRNQSISKIEVKNIPPWDIEAEFPKSCPNEVSVIIDNKQHLSNNVDATDTNITYSVVSREDEHEMQDEQDTSSKQEKKLFREELEKLIDPISKVCKVCSMNFEKKVELNRHLLLVHKVKAQKLRRKRSEIEAVAFCDACDKGFTRRFDMIKHRKSKHNLSEGDTETSSKRINIIKRCAVEDGDGKQVYRCDVCGHVFKQSYSLMRHHTIHTGDRPYFCELCGKDFRTASGLNRHVNEFHYAIKKFQCEICSKQFKTRATKDEHMNIHTNTRPYVCDICGKAFKQKASLHVHKTYHSNSFRFACSICGNKYRRAQELKVHHWSHTGHKPFKCQVCDAQFRLRHDLKKHSATHL